MLDTFRPLQVGQGVQAIEDPEYCAELVQTPGEVIESEKQAAA